MPLSYLCIKDILTYVSRMSKKYDTFLRNESWLRQKSRCEKQTLLQIAKIVGCSGGAVWGALRKFDIPPTSPGAHKKGKKLPRETREKMAKAKRGEKNPNFGKKRSDEIKRKISESLTGRKFSEDRKRKISEVLKGKHHSEQTRKKMSNARKHRKFSTHHTKPELIFEAICKKRNLPFKYTGDGSFWIENINPDFIECNGKKIVVEIFGDYWHSPLLRNTVSYNQTYEGRKKILKKYGWRLIVFWGSDLLRKDGETFVLSVLKREKVL